MPQILDGSVRILSDAGLGMAIFSLGGLVLDHSLIFVCFFLIWKIKTLSIIGIPEPLKLLSASIQLICSWHFPPLKIALKNLRIAKSTINRQFVISYKILKCIACTCIGSYGYSCHNRQSKVLLYPRAVNKNILTWYKIPLHIIFH